MVSDTKLDILFEYVDSRIDGLENLFNTPSSERTLSAQDEYLKEAHFELCLIRDLIQNLQIDCQHKDFQSQRKKIFDSIYDRLDKYYYSLPEDSPYLDGIDMSSQEIEKLYAEGEV